MTVFALFLIMRFIVFIWHLFVFCSDVGWLLLSKSQNLSKYEKVCHFGMYSALSNYKKLINLLETKAQDIWFLSVVPSSQVKGSLGETFWQQSPLNASNIAFQFQCWTSSDPNLDVSDQHGMDTIITGVRPKDERALASESSCC